MNQGTYLKTDDEQINRLVPRIRDFMRDHVVEYNIMGDIVRGYTTADAPSLWIRDYSDMMRAFKFWDEDVQSVVRYFADIQSVKGWIMDYVTMTPEKLPGEKENWVKHVRVPVEADVEYRFIHAAYQAWQATGDDEWMAGLLENMERALEYIRTDPWRWDPDTQLVKRPLTIDTWDFDYTAGRHEWLNFQVTDDTCWGIMHGDNSGYYQAFLEVAQLHEYLGNPEKSAQWNTRAEALKSRANDVCFNGQFYTHHVHLVPVEIEGVDESEQLSLSNSMDINRGMATHEIAVKILEEYQRRGEEQNVFAEWFSIDPPFPDGIFGDEKLVAGVYSNGGIMPLVGGELAAAAFEHGFEKYGVDILRRYETLTKNGESYLWYFPDGTKSSEETSTSPLASNSDPWGSSAVMYALTKGLLGIQDLGKVFNRVRVAPRWIAAGVQEAETRLEYGPSGAKCGYHFLHQPEANLVTLKLKGNADVQLHLLLPTGAAVESVRQSGSQLNWAEERIEGSSYCNAEFRVDEETVVEVRYR